ncbi:MBL fold metallo-hydrolase [Pantoea stewartii]|uniref:MBL fold metallo-hydrolase n=1 Tax=Pantoea stewartii TaxID=66269 RepID=UPI000736902E|nr:MBL fold metallo-hydrolase [Pantoea stewartii]KTS29700.1 hypothetical protein NS381_03320 [Pantoea stewartii]
MLFGRGVGESILCNYESDDWIIVDSCYGKIDSEKKAASLEYLEENQIPLDKVKFIVISHFHDDHIKGMLEIVKKCTSAKIFISGALSSQEFVTYLTLLADVNATTAHQQGVSELFNIFSEAHKSKRKINKAKADVSLHFNMGTLSRVSALSPSDVECEEALSCFMGKVKTLSESHELELPADVKDKNLNHNCVTLCISSHSNTDILLGADLEISSDPLKGWTALTSTQLAPKNTASVFKISHHGSVNGHCQTSWNKLSITNRKPIGILTPFNKQRLPRAQQIQVLQQATSELYSTSPVKEYQMPKSDIKLLDIKKVKSVSRVNLNFGYIELNEIKDGVDNHYEVKTGGAAIKLS